MELQSTKGIPREDNEQRNSKETGDERIFKERRPFATFRARSKNQGPSRAYKFKVSRRFEPHRACLITLQETKRYHCQVLPKPSHDEGHETQGQYRHSGLRRPNHVIRQNAETPSCGACHVTLIDEIPRCGRTLDVAYFVFDPLHSGPGPESPRIKLVF
jgi:hypothetical protein